MKGNTGWGRERGAAGVGVGGERKGRWPFSSSFSVIAAKWSICFALCGGKGVSVENLGK